ncbi:unnamed protein product [Calicophoron daubneyi]|uniref:Uncharacterized protein n=1 Tax=Calicophoron daubneyi TaxID=300641 RepID=A0AAV2TD02_CALDB
MLPVRHLFRRFQLAPAIAPTVTACPILYHPVRLVHSLFFKSSGALPAGGDSLQLIFLIYVFSWLLTRAFFYSLSWPFHCDYCFSLIFWFEVFTSSNTAAFFSVCCSSV